MRTACTNHLIFLELTVLLILGKDEKYEAHHAALSNCKTLFAAKPKQIQILKYYIVASCCTLHSITISVHLSVQQIHI
jgi:hypothetical protein